MKKGSGHRNHKIIIFIFYTEKTKTKMNCDNCNRDIIYTGYHLKCDRYKALFFTLCHKCTNTCSCCGQDIGFSKSFGISNKQCDYCDKDSCRSCGVNIECRSCGMTVCEGCFDERHDDICISLKKKMKKLKKLE